MIPIFHKSPEFNKPAYTEKYGEFIKAWKYKDKKDIWLFCTACYDSGNLGTYGNRIRIFKKFIYKNNEWVIDNSKAEILNSIFLKSLNQKYTV